MTVQDVFELRKQGKIQEAYEAIVPLYHEHHGKYTTLAMFLVGIDKLRLNLDQIDTNNPHWQVLLEESDLIYKSLVRLYPKVQDEDETLKKMLNKWRKVLDTCKKLQE